MINPYPFFRVPYFNRFSPYYRTYNSPYNGRGNFIRQPQNLISPNVCKQKEQENDSCSNSTNKNNNFNSNTQNKTNISYSNQHGKKNNSFYNNSKYKNDNNFSCSFSHVNTDNCSSINNVNNFDDFSEECFEIFGLKLYFDDLLIIALLFFLYQEDVKDTYLYISLILLLLS